jgi:hypothetical protein
MKPKSKSIGKFRMKGLSDEGNITRHYFDVRDNGVVYINQFILSKEPKLQGFDAVNTRFGKTLHRTCIGFKYGTIAGIFKALNDTLVKNNIKEGNILQ